MVKLKNGTLVVVTDSEKTLFLVNQTDGDDPNLQVMDKHLEDNPPDRAQKTDGPGGHKDTAAGQRSNFEETDFHRLQKDRYAGDLADRLYKMAHDQKFDSLVLVAPPQVLGVMRDAMHKEVRDKLLAEIDKTMTGMPLDDMEVGIVDALAQMDDHVA
jgi:protein required for attachment to host cells